MGWYGSPERRWYMPKLFKLDAFTLVLKSVVSIQEKSMNSTLQSCILGLCKSVSYHQLTAAEDETTGFRNVVGTLGLILHIHTYSRSREDSSPSPTIFSSQFPDVMILSFVSHGFTEYKVSLSSIATRHVLRDLKGSRI